MSTPEERFEKWVRKYVDDVGHGAWSGVDVKAAYLAATEDAARIAEEMYDRELPELHHIEIAISDEIYAAIREGK